MEKIKRIISAVMAASFLMPVLAGCAKRGSGDVISKDDPWYDVTAIEMGDSSGSDEYEYSYCEFTAFDGENLVYRFQGSRRLPDDFDWDNFDEDLYESYQVDRLDLYDLDGQIISSVDLMDIIRGIDADGAYFNNISRDDEGFYADITEYDYISGDEQLLRVRIDLASGATGEIVPVEEDDAVNRIREIDDASDEGIMPVGDYEIRKFWIYGNGDNNSYILAVKGADGESTVIDMRDEFPGLNIFDISTVIDIGNDKGLIIASGDGNMFFVIDFADMSVTRTEEDMSWIGQEIYSLRYVEGIGTVTSSDTGISKIDYDAKEVTPVFDFTDSNVNLLDMSNVEPVFIDDDRAIFTGYVYNSVAGSDSVSQRMMLYIFDRADTNPNAGKTIIDLAPLQGRSQPLCSAICEFNETNEDYFIKIDTSYQDQINQQIFAAYNESDGEEIDWDQISDSTSASVGNQLAIDIMSGTGPDIIVDGAEYTMFNNDEYLVDLSEFIDTNLNPDDYFTNVFDAARTDGALYQIPLSFYILGIVTDASNVDDGQIGFTFDQYGEFVEGPCNGSAPINGGKMNFLIQCLDCMPDLVFADGTASYDTDAFRALAEYTAQNVNEDLSQDDSQIITYDDDYEQPVASTAYISDVAEYFNNIQGGRRVLLGFPSYDGRGPVIRSSNSVAVSAQSDSRDACLDFVALMLSEQMNCLNYNIPVNRAAFEANANAVIDAHNREVDEQLRYSTEDELRRWGYNPEYMDGSSISDYGQIIEQLSGWYSNDGAVNAIIREEIPAYFEGQKTLDQVIPVLEDRVRTVLSERG